MKNKFNWNRFYDELEQGDPGKFPYWMFLLNELGDIVLKIVTGIVAGIVITIIIMSTMFYLLDDVTFQNYVKNNMLEAYCKSR